MTSNILAMSDPLPVAMWTSRFEGYHPQFKPSREQATWVPRVDEYARRVTDRWLYILVETHADQSAFAVGYEAQVADDGNIVFCRRNPGVGPWLPIPLRGEPLTVEGNSGPSAS